MNSCKYFLQNFGPKIIERQQFFSRMDLCVKNLVCPQLLIMDSLSPDHEAELFYKAKNYEENLKHSRAQKHIW